MWPLDVFSPWGFLVCRELSCFSCSETQAHYVNNMMQLLCWALSLGNIWEILATETFIKGFNEWCLTPISEEWAHGHLLHSLSKLCHSCDSVVGATVPLYRRRAVRNMSLECVTWRGQMHGREHKYLWGLTGVQVPVTKSEEYSVLVGSVCAGSILSWFVRKGGNCHRRVPSLILTAGLCLKHKAGWKCRDAFTSLLKHSTVARAVLGFGFGFWRNCGLQLCLASPIRGSVALTVIFMYFILCVFSRSVFPKLRVAIPFYIWKHSKTISKH